MPLNIPAALKRRQAQQKQLSYKNLIKMRFRQQVSVIVKKYSLDQLVLILDATTTLLISDLFKIHQLVDMKITYLQRLQVKRKKMPLLHGLYFITPFSKSIEFLKKDYPQKQLTQQKAKRQYKKVHILFTSFASHGIIKEIATHKPLLKRIATNSIKQFYHSTKFMSNNVVNFGVQGYGALAYSKQSAEQTDKRIRVAEKVLQFVVNLGQVNAVRLYYKKSYNEVSERIAEYSQKMINKYIGNLLENKSHILKKQAEDVTIIILDRSIDPVTPLLHSFTYEALFFDLLKVTFEGSKKEQDKQYYKFKQFNDSIYEIFRYQHISQALEQIPNMLNKQNQKLSSLKTQNSDKSKADQNQIDISDLNQKIQGLRRHIEIVSTIYSEIKQKDLMEIGETQMCLTTGLTDQGKVTSSSKVFDDVLQIIQKNTKISKQQKLRLGLLVLSGIKLSKKDYQKLLQAFPDEDDKTVLRNIIALGITYDKSIGKSTKAIKKDAQNIALERLQRTGVPLDRYTTLLQIIIPNLVEILSGENPKIKRLDEDIFGSLKCICLEDEKLDLIKFNIDKFVLIMIGGLSLAEISALRRRDQLKNIIIGADQIIQPKKYLEMLKYIDILE